MKIMKYPGRYGVETERRCRVLVMHGNQGVQRSILVKVGTGSSGHMQGVAASPKQLSISRANGHGSPCFLAQQSPMYLYISLVQYLLPSWTYCVWQGITIFWCTSSHIASAVNSRHPSSFVPVPVGSMTAGWQSKGWDGTDARQLLCDNEPQERRLKVPSEG